MHGRKAVALHEVIDMGECRGHPAGEGRVPRGDLEWIHPHHVVGDSVEGLRGRIEVTLQGGRRLVVDAEGSWDRPYEPFHRGGLNQMKVRTDDGREGTAIYEVTGARHWKYFPDCAVEGTLPQS